MNVGSWLLWGFLATLLLTTFMALGQGMGYTRMSIPYLLGTIFSSNRERAKVLGFLFHLVNGWIFSLLYVAAFHALGRANIWIGALFGFFHASFLLTVGMTMVPVVHPRMAKEGRPPSSSRLVEPPGFFALHYGRSTPLWTLVAHILFGMILGALYEFH